METKLIGRVGVDSGQLILTDPCYLKDFKSNDCSLMTYATVDYKDGKKPKEVLIDKKLIDLINKGKVKILKKYYKDKKDYSYNGCCVATLSDERAGQLENNGFDEVGVAFSTGWGDGSYPVYATYDDDGRISKVEVVFTEQEETCIECRNIESECTCETCCSCGLKLWEGCSCEEDEEDDE